LNGASFLRPSRFEWLENSGGFLRVFRVRLGNFRPVLRVRDELVPMILSGIDAAVWLGEEDQHAKVAGGNGVENGQRSLGSVVFLAAIADHVEELVLSQVRVSVKIVFLHHDSFIGRERLHWALGSSEADVGLFAIDEALSLSHLRVVAIRVDLGQNVQTGVNVGPFGDVDDLIAWSGLGEEDAQHLGAMFLPESGSSWNSLLVLLPVLWLHLHNGNVNHDPWLSRHFRTVQADAILSRKLPRSSTLRSWPMK